MKECLSPVMDSHHLRVLYSWSALQHYSHIELDHTFLVLQVDLNVVLTCTCTYWDTLVMTSCVANIDPVVMHMTYSNVSAVHRINWCVQCTRAVQSVAHTNF